MGLTWTSKDGRVTAFEDMHPSHIRNCIAMIRRQGFCSMREFYQAINHSAYLGDNAREAAAEVICQMNPTLVIDALEQELEKRDEPY